MFFHYFVKAYPTLDSQSAKHITALGNLCGAIQRLPTSAQLSVGLEKRGYIAVASGGFTDIWRGSLSGVQVAIKAFRIYPAQNLKEAKEVNRTANTRVRSPTTFPDSVQTSTGVGQVIAPEHLAVPWRQHDPLSAVLRLRLGAKRQHHSIFFLPSRRISGFTGAQTPVAATMGEVC